MSDHVFTLILHILGAGVLIGIVFLSLVISIPQPLTEARLRWLNYIRSFGLYAAFWQFLTGLHLAQHHWMHIKDSPLFWAKMGLFLLDGFLAERVIKKKIDAALATQNNQPVQHLAVWMYASALIFTLIVSFSVFLANS